MTQLLLKCFHASNYRTYKMKERSGFGKLSQGPLGNVGNDVLYFSFLVSRCGTLSVNHYWKQ